MIESRPNANTLDPTSPLDEPVSSRHDRTTTPLPAPSIPSHRPPSPPLRPIEGPAPPGRSSHREAFGDRAHPCSGQNARRVEREPRLRLFGGEHLGLLRHLPPRRPRVALRATPLSHRPDAPPRDDARGICRPHAIARRIDGEPVDRGRGRGVGVAQGGLLEADQVQCVAGEDHRIAVRRGYLRVGAVVDVRTEVHSGRAVGPARVEDPHLPATVHDHAVTTVGETAW